MATIEVDVDVCRWIESLAKPLEDTPNSVLRRVAGLDKSDEPSRTEGATHRTDVSSSPSDGTEHHSGSYLAQLWGVTSAQSLYHNNGTCYDLLERFPGALFDANGYVLFPDKNDYRSCLYLRITQELNVPDGIESIPSYNRMR